jgi:DNA repair protein RadA/Sms
MAKPRSVYCCTACGGQQPRWLGRCPDCGAWESLVEESVGAEGALPTGLVGAAGTAKPRPLGEIDPNATARVPTGIPEFDRVLGGGLVAGSVVLLGGEPGIGKSTLALQAATKIQATGARVLYVSGEESAEQLRLRADRLASFAPSLHVLTETCIESIAGPWAELEPDFVLIDSIQTMRTERIESAAGSVAQVRECAALLSTIAKRENTALLLVGHVTKDGQLAGPRVLEHLVDVVLAFEGDRAHTFRLLRAQKNRFGSTQEVGVFTMGAAGLEDVENPSELFLEERSGGGPGSCVVPVLEGTRPMLVELQALVAPSTYGTARRTCIGIEDGRIALLLAVLDRRTDIDLLSRDIYANVAGGVRVAEPSADLAMCLAIASSCLDIPVPTDVAACGEVGLGGEVRRVGRLDLRVREAARLGFTRVLAPASASIEAPRNCELIPISNVGEAVQWLRGVA